VPLILTVQEYLFLVISELEWESLRKQSRSKIQIHEPLKAKFQPMPASCDGWFFFGEASSQEFFGDYRYMVATLRLA
jgi:hypothetical protein